MREFVREHRRQLGVVGDIVGDRGRDLDVAAVGLGVEPARRDQLEAARAALLGADRQRAAARRRAGSRARRGRRRRPRRARRGSAPSARSCGRGPARRAAAAWPSRPSRTSSSRSPARSAGPPGTSASTPGPASSPNARIAAGRKSAPYCERSWTAKPGRPLRAPRTGRGWRPRAGARSSRRAGRARASRSSDCSAGAWPRRAGRAGGEQQTEAAELQERRARIKAFSCRAARHAAAANRSGNRHRP